jgi:hypothetical protein
MQIWDADERWLRTQIFVQKPNNLRLSALIGVLFR